MFANRQEAAEELAESLAFLRGEDLVVLAIPNNGVPVGVVIAKALSAPLDVLLVERLHAPRNPEHVVGAVDEHGHISLIESTARWHHLTTQKMIAPAREAFKQMQRRRARFRALLPELDVRGKTVVIVNEGVSSGATMLGAVMSVRNRGATKVIAAAPAGDEKATWQLHEAAHMVVIPHKPTHYRGIEKFYKNYEDIRDESAIEMLRRYLTERGVEVPQVTSIAMRFLVDGERMIYCEADLPPGEGPFPAVIFTHGFESDCRSARSVPISLRLARRRIAGIRMDFQGHGRSEGSADACTHENMVHDLQLVYDNLCYDSRIDENIMAVCGSGTGGMVAVEFAAREPRVRSVVVRGPICHDEIPAAAHDLAAPTLLIHCEEDINLEEDVLQLNQAIQAKHQMLRIPECNRLFNDPISRELMISASVDWLTDHIRAAQQEAGSESPAATTG